MKPMKLSSITIIILMLFVAMLFAQKVSAQTEYLWLDEGFDSGIPLLWSNGDSPCTPETQSDFHYTADSGFPEPAIYTGAGETGAIGVPIDPSYEITSIRVEVGASGVPMDILLCNGGSIVYEPASINESSGAGDIVWTFETPISGGSKLWFVVIAAGKTVDNFRVYLASDPGAGIPLLYKPIQEANTFDSIVPRYTSGIFSGEVSGDSTITALPLSSSPIPQSVPVYAPIAGIISNVSPSAPYSITLEGDYGDAVLEVQINGLNDIYVNEGDIIDAQCIIGLAGPYINEVDTSGLSQSEIQNLKQVTYSIYNEVESGFLDWTTHLDPSGSHICGSRMPSLSCLNNNPYLSDNADGWTFEQGTGNRLLPRSVSDGVNIPSLAGISQYLTLDGGTYYVTLTVILRDYQYGSIDVSLGDQTITTLLYADLPDEHTFGVQIGGPQTLLIGPFTDPSPDLLPDTYKLTIHNNFTGHVVAIAYACVSGESDPTVSDVPACYFGALDDLDTTGTLEEDLLGTPYFQLSNADTITQGLVLQGYLDSDATYNIEVMVGGSPLSPESDPASDGHLLLSFDDGDTDYITVGDFSIPPRTGLGMIKDSIIIPNGETVSATFTLTYAPDDTTDSEFLYISSICLYPRTGIWPGKEPPPESSGGGGGAGSGGLPNTGPGSGLCAPTIAPTGTDVWQWIVWLFSSISKLFFCFLPTQISRVVNSILDVIKAIGSIGAWLLAVFQLLARWIFNLTGWLINTAVGLVGSIFESIWSALVGLPLLQWLYDQLAIGKLLFDLITALVSGILNLILLIVQAFASLVNMLNILWGSLLAGINGTGTIDIGITSCVDVEDTDFFFTLCQFNALLDYTYDVFPSLWAPITVILAAVIIRTFITSKTWVGEMLGGFN